VSEQREIVSGGLVYIFQGEDFTSRPDVPAVAGHSKTAQKILRAQKQPAAPTLFFGNLGFEATEGSIREMLEAHRKTKTKKKAETEEKKDGWIRKIRMGTFEDSGLCKG
jgi:hypothetical protein